MIPFNTKILPGTKGVYMVGGSVRDLILGQRSTDYDIVVRGNPEKFARKLSENLSGRLVKMGKPGQVVFRVVSREHLFDISAIKGLNIETDLIQRDFTVNAMAYSFFSKTIIDPLNGLKDMAEKKVRMTSSKIFKKDPVRLLRAYRIGATLKFTIEQRTADAVEKNIKLIGTSAAERIRFEIFSILCLPESKHSFFQMAGNGLLFKIFPELFRTKGCFQNKIHLFDVFDHTMRTFYLLENLLSDDHQFEPEITRQIRRHMDQKRSAQLKCATLFHDIGKPLARTIDQNGNIHFSGHEQKGVDMAKKICKRLKFSVRETGYIDFIIKNHLKPLFFFTAGREKDYTRGDLTRFFMKLGDFTPDLLIHAIADTRGKGNENDERNAAFIRFIKNLIHRYFVRFKPRSKAPPLITGADLIHHFGLTPSPLFKTILNRVEERTLSNGLRDRTAALIFVEELLGRRIKA
ncbi:MAG: HD domain-containing protein [Desulfobacterales bacterium]|nr:HD domain-containing protein [Desulfobacterales bacterium]MDP6683677.1 HD domain-containing protein [Desulfobacterales bacterium]MDP6807882.1 HD domain-containing protein [Desulfobacterales bacterium]